MRGEKERSNLQVDNDIPIPWVGSQDEKYVLINKRVLMNLSFIQTQKIRDKLSKNKLLLRLFQKKFEVKLLQYHNQLTVFAPYHPSSEDELKWINVSYNEILAKKDVMSQTLNCMDGS